MKVEDFLKTYFEVFCESELENNSDWIESLYQWIKFFQELKGKNKEQIIEEFKKTYNAKDEIEIINLLFNTQDNGMGNIGRGAGLVKKDKNIFEEVIKVINSNFEDINFDNFTKNVSIDNKKAYAAAHRFLRVVFSDKLTPLDPKDKHYVLLHKLKDLENFEYDNSIWEYKNKFKFEKDVMGKIDCKSCEDSEVYKKIKEKLQEIDENILCYTIKQVFFWVITEMFDNDLISSKTIVYYGAPGTGKTYKARKIAREIINNWKLRTFGEIQDIEEHIKVVQFHPSFSYEDFIEGIRPDENGNFKVYDGVFRDFCKKAGEIEIKLWKNKNFREKFKDKAFCEIKLEDLIEKEVIYTDEDEVKKLFNISKNFENVKDLTLEEVIPPYIFIIDEINRAELSKVFGELMYALEYRGYAGKIKTQYSYLRKKNDFFYEENGEDYFFVPHNVYILATMNTIDRSVDIFDFAMRRRFAWERVDTDYELIKKELNTNIVTNEKSLGDKLSKSLEELNKKIKDKEILGEDYQIGHAYILQIKKCPKTFSSVKEVKEYLWNRNLKPLLEEYLKGMVDKKQIKEKLEEFKEAWDKNE